MWLRPRGYSPPSTPSWGFSPLVDPPREGRVAAAAGRIPRPWPRATGFQFGSPPEPGGLSDPCGHVLGAPRTPFWPLILGRGKMGQKWPIFAPLRCKVVGEWGGSAH